ncbi:MULTISPECIES: hypothetical protein [unclassified Rhizobium]|uniref:hypothetical protein n=1 Tax=unclassified Rhizobium TaxID=2613769 RepID=UPI001FCDC3DC|nr:MULTISPECIES: hypothetical protein [unclassified Rhizobium]
MDAGQASCNIGEVLAQTSGKRGLCQTRTDEREIDEKATGGATGADLSRSGLRLLFFADRFIVVPAVIVDNHHILRLEIGNSCRLVKAAAHQIPPTGGKLKYHGGLASRNHCHLPFSFFNRSHPIDFFDYSRLAREMRGLIKKKSQSLKNRPFFRQVHFGGIFEINFVRVHLNQITPNFAQISRKATCFLKKTTLKLRKMRPFWPKNSKFASDFAISGHRSTLHCTNRPKNGQRA